jgi:hypothetical protein
MDTRDQQIMRDELTDDELTDDVRGHVGNHPIVTAELARQRTDALRADAARSRLAAEAGGRHVRGTAATRPGPRALLLALVARARARRATA